MTARPEPTRPVPANPEAEAAIADLLQDCPVIVDVPVWWGDLDAFDHVNNTVYFRWFEHARIAYFDRIDILQIRRDTGIGPILATTDCRFRIPLTYPDKVRVGTTVQEVGDDRFLMRYRVASLTHGKLAAEGSGLIVTFDYQQQRKAALPARMRAAIEALEGASLDR